MDYSGPTYDIINGYLRNVVYGTKQSAKTWKLRNNDKFHSVNDVINTIQKIDNIIWKKTNPSNREIFVYRGISVNPSKKTNNTDSRLPMIHYEIGNNVEIFKSSYISTTYNSAVGNMYTRVYDIDALDEFMENNENPCCLFMIRLPRGTRAINMESLSQIPEEHEILLPHGCDFKVVDIIQQTRFGKQDFKDFKYTIYVLDLVKQTLNQIK